MDEAETTKGGGRRAAGIGMAILLILCVTVLVFWEVMSGRNRRPGDAFELTSEDFAGFVPKPAGWDVRRMPLKHDPIEPNILVYEMSRQPGIPGVREVECQKGRLVFRIVHGYNLCDCMRIKGYTVELQEDRRKGVGGSPLGGRVQVWRMVSSGGDVSFWVSGVVRAGGFSDTDVDVREMAFPRVGVPDDPNWVPQGMTWSSLRHPVDNLEVFFRALWNSARCDLLTFLKLRKPAWANDELLTLVVAWRGSPVPDAQEAGVKSEVIEAYRVMRLELSRWESGLNL